MIKKKIKNFRHFSQVISLVKIMLKMMWHKIIYYFNQPFSILELHYINNAKKQVESDVSCLKQEKITFHHKTIINLYIAYDVHLWLLNLESKFALGNSLFGAVRLAKRWAW